MMTGTLSRNVGNLSSELKLVTGNLSLYLTMHMSICQGVATRVMCTHISHELDQVASKNALGVATEKQQVQNPNTITAN